MTTSRRTATAVLLALGLVAAACSSEDAGIEPASTPAASAATAAPAATEAPSSDTAAPEPAATEAPTATEAATEADTTEPPATDAPAATDAPVTDDPSSAFPDLAPPTGDPFVVGLVNTEGTPGLDFPTIRVDIGAAVDYLNLHGGMGGRPIQLENCKVNGSPETSQACAQELTGKQVDLVMLGLDLFPDYATYTAANVPVIGVLPILPGDYTANALFMTGGNATTMGAMAAVARDHFGAKTVGIVSADNPGANSSEASLTASLDVAGIAHVTVKGGDSETDAGYQGLMREAAKDNPDLLVSLYSDAGCIGAMRGRAALGITIPVITTGICSSADVLDVVGDDAIGWTFVGAATRKESPELHILQDVMAPALGVTPDEVDVATLGLGGLALNQMMSLAEYADMMQAEGTEITGASIYEYLRTSTGLLMWPKGAEMACGSAEKYPSVCSFTFPVAEYLAGGVVETIDGLEAVSAKELLP